MSIREVGPQFNKTSEEASGGERTRYQSETAKPDSSTEALPPLYRDLVQSHGKLEQELYERTMTLATLAHEIKNPLAIVSGYVELLLEQKVGPLTDRQQKVLEAAKGNCQHLQRLTQDFLSYSALEAGGDAFPVNFEMGDLNECLAEVCGYWVPKFTGAGVALFCRANPQIAHFRFDYYKVQQVVANLLDNALKFTGRGGSVWVTAEPHAWDRRRGIASNPRVERRKGGPGGPNTVRVTVADTGIGIAGEFHLEVFDDFFRISERKDGPQGAGLGLAISRRLVHLHGGKIWVESEPGAGSKFSFLLPLSQPDQ
jgi:signal transduction histidine kinase